jgi:hypothetical protein
VLNLFIAVIVDTMQKSKEPERESGEPLAEVRRELAALGRKIDALATRGR